jgi:hypothetical protein
MKLILFFSKPFGQTTFFLLFFFLPPHNGQQQSTGLSLSSAQSLLLRCAAILCTSRPLSKPRPRKHVLTGGLAHGPAQGELQRPRAQWQPCSRRPAPSRASTSASSPPLHRPLHRTPPSTSSPPRLHARLRTSTGPATWPLVDRDKSAHGPLGPACVRRSRCKLRFSASSLSPLLSQRQKWSFMGQADGHRLIWLVKLFFSFAERFISATKQAINLITNSNLCKN